MELNITATGYHLPYGITHLPPDPSEHTPALSEHNAVLWLQPFKPFNVIASINCTCFISSHHYSSKYKHAVT